MKIRYNIFAFALIAAFLMAMHPADQYFGKKIEAQGAVAAGELLKSMKDKNSLSLKVKGTISSVCQAKGCWMVMDLGNGQLMRISFKDYAFFVPKDCSGKQTVIQGVASRKVTKEAERRHYAKDAGKSAEEIEKITGDLEEVTFEAEGVIILG